MENTKITITKKDIKPFSRIWFLNKLMRLFGFEFVDGKINDEEYKRLKSGLKI